MKKIILSSLIFSLFSCQNFTPNDNNKVISNTQSKDIKPEKIEDKNKPSPLNSENHLNIVKSVIDFSLTSSDFKDGGDYPKKYTCDGDSASPLLSWSNPPTGTVSYAVTMHHIPGPGDEHVYMVIYDIPSNINTLASNEKNIGKWGINTVNGKTEYAPPCSKGPGPKPYIITLYALSSVPIFSNNIKITKDILIDSIKDKVLGTSAITVTYSRS